MQQFTRTAMLFIEKHCVIVKAVLAFLVLLYQAQMDLFWQCKVKSLVMKQQHVHLVFIDSSTALSYIGESDPKMMLLWTKTKVLILHQLTDGSILLITSTEINSYHTVLKFSLDIAKNSIMR
jgi:hypothetical protein